MDTEMMAFSDTEIVEELCGVTVHGLDRIKERFDGKITELLIVITRHLEMINFHKLTGPTICTLNGISTVIESVDGLMTLVTAYPNIKGEKNYSKHKRSKRSRLNDRKTKWRKL